MPAAPERAEAAPSSLEGADLQGELRQIWLSGDGSANSAACRSQALDVTDSSGADGGKLDWCFSSPTAFPFFLPAFPLIILQKRC